MTIENTENPTEENVATENSTKATELINLFLRENKHENNTIAWAVHVFCRVDRGDDCRYKFDEIENARSFIDKLTAFFLTSDNAKRYEESDPSGYNKLSDYLPRLKELFERFGELVCEAQLDEVDSRHGYLLPYDKEKEQLLIRHYTNQIEAARQLKLIYGRFYYDRLK